MFGRMIIAESRPSGTERETVRDRALPRLLMTGSATQDNRKPGEYEFEFGTRQLTDPFR
jgi:hypothetical protein